MADYRLELINASLKTVGLISASHGFSFSLALYGGGRNGALALHLDDPLAREVIGGTGQWYVRIYRDGSYLRAFLVEQVTYGYGGGDDYIAMTLTPLEQLFKRAWCVPALAGGTFATPYLPLDDAVKWIVDHSCGPHAYQSPASGLSRVIAGLEIDTALSAHPTSRIEGSANRKCLYEFLTKFAPAYDIDFSLELEPSGGDDNRLMFYTYYPRRGLDKTLDNGVVMPVLINDASVSLPAGERNLNFVGVTAVISEDLITEVRDAATEAICGRHELLAQSKDANELAALLEKNKLRDGEEWRFVESDALRILRDFSVGDLVSVNNLTLGLNTRDELVREMFIQCNPDGQEEITVVFGDYPKNLLDKIEEGATGGGGDGSIWTTDEWDVHPPVTLEAHLGSNLLGITVQELTLDKQQPHMVFAGPASGTDADYPTWRAMAAGDVPAHDIIGALHTIAGSAMQLVGATSANTLGLLTPSSAPGVASSVLKTDVSGNLAVQTLGCVKLNFATNEYLDLASAGNLRLAAGTSVGTYVNGTLTLYVASALVRPGTNNAVSLGNTDYRWLNIHTVGFNHSGTTMTVRSVEYTLPSANAAGVLTNNGSGGLAWTGPAYASHVHSISYSNTATGSTQPSLSGHTDNWVVYGSPNWGSNPVCDSSGTTLYLYCSYSSSGSNPFWYIGRIGATPHYHNLSGGDASASVASHYHTYDKAQSTTGGPS